MSDDNDDKTRMQPPNRKGGTANGTTNNSNGTAAPTNNGSSASDDKTRIAPKDPELEKKRRLIAKKKQLEMERRLAAANKKPAQAPVSDKTQIQPRSAQKPPAQHTPPLESSEKTQFQPRRSAPASQGQNGESAQSDATQFQPRRQTPAEVSNEGSDKTTFKPRPAAQAAPQSKNPGTSDPTTINRDSQANLASAQSESEKAGVQDMLKGRFVFEKVLGAGGMGVVYKAKDLLKVEAQDRDPYVAIKVLGEEFKAHPEAFIALQRESRKTQRIAHPNIVNVHDFDRDGDTVFMTMEYLEGKPLDKLIGQYKATGLPEEDVWKILEGISAALIYAHEQKIIHSDFKPGNIFVTSNNVAKVFDFGIARAVAKAEAIEDSVDDKTVFDAGNLGALTPAYASLEMLEGKTPDPRDDIYALGCIAYEMFTGNHPFNRVHANEAMRQKLKPKRIPFISKRKWRVIEKALAFKREDRIKSVDEFWSEIQKKGSVGLLATTAAVIILALGGFIVYQNYFAPQENTISEDEIRSEIERDLLISQNKKTITDLLVSKDFSPRWENNIYEAHQTLEKWIGAEDPWLVDSTQAIYGAYVEKVLALIAEKSFDHVRGLIDNAARYTANQENLKELSDMLAAAEEAHQQQIEEEKKAQQFAQQQQQEKRQQAAEQKEKNAAFDVAMKTVEEQLKCRSTMKMRDVGIAVEKLRSLNASRYSKAEGSIVTALASCIEKIGTSFPERGTEFKKRAMRIFPQNTTISGIKIKPKDPCDIALAGLGARGNRAVCRDPLKNEGSNLGKGPGLVVVPEKGSLKAFAIGKYEISVAEFNVFCENTGSCPVNTATNEKMPVTNISVQMANEYLAWLTRVTKHRYRLPTKVEWTYASRAGSSKLDSNRNCRLDSRGIKKGGSLIHASTGQQNSWGLVNYLGNAQEFVDNGNGFSAAGGSYETAIEDCVVTRIVQHNGNADATTGFRVVREIEAK